jgi:hypothetical protein
MTIKWAHGTPIMWSAKLAKAEGQFIRRGLKELAALSPAERNFPAKPVGRKSPLAAACLVTLGQKTARSLLEPLLPVVGDAIEQCSRVFDADPSDFGIDLSSFINALQCAGVHLNASTEKAPLVEWLRLLSSEPKLVNPHERIGTALACLAMGIHEPVTALLGKKKLPTRFEPGAGFYDDLTSYVSFLAVALEKGRSAADVEMAWKALVWSFPTLETKCLVSWNDLLWAARIHYHLFEKRPLGEVGAALYDFVRTN